MTGSFIRKNGATLWIQYIWEQIFGGKAIYQTWRRLNWLDYYSTRRKDSKVNIEDERVLVLRT